MVCNVLRRAIKESIPNAFPRVQLDLSASVFASTLNTALGQNLSEPFNPYANSLNWLLAIYLVPYVGLTGYVGAIPRISSRTARRVRLFCHYSVLFMIMMMNGYITIL